MVDLLNDIQFHIAGLGAQKQSDPTVLLLKRAANDLAKMHYISIDAKRYRWLRMRDVDTIHRGGIFAGITPQNVVVNGDDLDAAIDAAIARGES